MLHLILFIAAAVCFFCATINVKTSINLTALGLLFWVLTNLV